MSKLPYEAPHIAVHGDIRDLMLDGGGGHRWRWWHHHHHDPDPTFSVATRGRLNPEPVGV